MLDKAALRREIRARFPGQEARKRESTLICRHILESELYKSARVIGGYMPMMREADITPVLEDVLRSGRTLALPLCDAAPRMTIRRVADLSALIPGAYGIPEPSPDAPMFPVEDLDLLLVPLEGISPSGMRLGKGGGYYDALLQGCRPVTLGCALKCQWSRQIPADPWDIPLYACADAVGIHVFGLPDIDERR